MGLDRIEFSYAVDLGVELFNFFKLEVLDEAWVQVLELSWCRELFREEQMLE